MIIRADVSACFNCLRITLDELEDESLQGVRRLWRPKRYLGRFSPITGITSSLAAAQVLRVTAKSEKLRLAMLNCRSEFTVLTNQLSFVNLPPRSESGCTVKSIHARVLKRSQ